MDVKSTDAEDVNEHGSGVPESSPSSTNSDKAASLPARPQDQFDFDEELVDDDVRGVTLKHLPLPKPESE